MSTTILGLLSISSIVLVLVMRSRQASSLALFSIFYIVPLLNIPQVPIDTRALSALIVLSQIPQLLRRGREAILRPCMAPFVALVALLAIGTFSVSWTTSWAASVESLFGLLLLVVGGLVFASLHGTRTIVVTMLHLFVFTGIASLVIAVAAPEMGIENGRVRGIVENANGLGTIASLGALLAAGWVQRPAKLIALFLFVAAASGSRGATLAALVGLALHLLLVRSGPRAYLSRGAMALSMLYFGSLLLAAWHFIRPDILVLRTNDSRTEVWLALVPIIESTWPLGSGLGTLETFSTNSYLKSAAEMGVLGLLGILAYVIALAFSSRGSAAKICLLVTTIIATTFESWLVTGGSFYAFVVLLILSSTYEPGWREKGGPIIQGAARSKNVDTAYRDGVDLEFSRMTKSGAKWI